MILTIPTHFYPTRGADVLTGTAKRAPSGLPVEIVETRTSGKGRNKSTRVLVRSAAPDGWGEWSGATMYAWIEKAALRSPRWEVVESRVWQRDDGAKASIYGACPWSSDADKARWQVVPQGWTLRNIAANTVGTGRAPYVTREEAQRACDEFNAR